MNKSAPGNKMYILNKRSFSTLTKSAKRRQKHYYLHLVHIKQLFRTVHSKRLFRTLYRKRIFRTVTMFIIKLLFRTVLR